VRCLYEPRTPLYPNQHIEAGSAPVTFEVVETPPIARQRRILRLTQQIKNGVNVPQAARLLGFTGNPDAIPPLLEVLALPDDRTHVAGVEALLYLDHTRVKDALMEFLRQRGPRERMVHLLVVSLKAPPQEVIPLLLLWLDNGDEGIRSAIMWRGKVRGTAIAGEPCSGAL
jgi:hypothetical protein